MQFEHLCSPIKIGNSTAKNRIIFSCHGVGVSFPEYIGYQVARARGGCGMNIIGPITIHPSGGLGGPDPYNIETPEMLIPKWKKMAEAVHEYGTLMLVQLFHAGEKGPDLTKVSWGVSENPVDYDIDRATVPHEMTDSEIEEVIEGYAAYARAAKEAGMDGCEIHGAHGYLPPQFWSSWANHRKDKWVDPMLFITEVIDRIRAAVGENFIFSIRMSGDDLYPGPEGMDVERSKKLAQALEATGKIDMLNISGGHGGNTNSYIIAPMYVPPGSISIPLASGIKQAVKSIPVVACSRINDPALADKAIADGHCDLVGVVRGQIADPEFGNKAREGRAEDIRLCIACNQGCSINGRPDCTQNYVAGRETTEIAMIKSASKRKRVMVVGGGPAGMEAARVAALRGHEVTLYEKDSQLGGRINVLSKAPGREEFNQVTRYLTIQLPKVGVEVKLNAEVTPETVMEDKPDVVIVATGSLDYTEPVAGSNTTRVVNPSQVLRGEVDPGKKVVIYENSGHSEGPTVADFLGEKGVQVELVTSQLDIGMRWGMNIGILATQNPFMWQRLRKNRVNVTRLAGIKRISGRTVTLVDVWSGEERTIDDVDTVVMATGYLPDNTLYKLLRDDANGPDELYVIGDSAAPRRSLNAIHDGYLTAFYI